jgi:3-methyl-2-oxobutanoate hydroxymethyltransferase
VKNLTAISHLREMKQNQEKIACLTAYDASFARLLESQEIDVILVGDSLGMVLHGETNTLKASMDDMVYHTKIVRKGITHTLLASDMPYNSYNDKESALKNAARLIDEGDADMVKLEGGQDILEQIEILCQEGISVCGHLGLQPQSVQKYGGYKVQGRNQQEAERIFDDAMALDNAGVKMIVLECIPHQLAAKITQAISVPTIGIGAGVDCDGQILVLYDVIGISDYIPKMANDFLQDNGSISQAVNDYIRSVKAGTFPTLEQSFE